MRQRATDGMKALRTSIVGVRQVTPESPHPYGGLFLAPPFPPKIQTTQMGKESNAIYQKFCTKLFSVYEHLFSTSLQTFTITNLETNPFGGSLRKIQTFDCVVNKGLLPKTQKCAFRQFSMTQVLVHLYRPTTWRRTTSTLTTYRLPTTLLLILSALF